MRSAILKRRKVRRLAVWLRKGQLHRREAQLLLYQQQNTPMLRNCVSQSKTPRTLNRHARRLLRPRSQPLQQSLQSARASRAIESWRRCSVPRPSPSHLTYPSVRQPRPPAPTAHSGDRCRSVWLRGVQSATPLRLPLQLRPLPLLLPRCRRRQLPVLFLRMLFRPLLLLLLNQP